jgi:hypothetical protein
LPRRASAAACRLLELKFLPHLKWQSNNGFPKFTARIELQRAKKKKKSGEALLQLFEEAKKLIRQIDDLTHGNNSIQSQLFFNKAETEIAEYFHSVLRQGLDVIVVGEMITKYTTEF